MASEPGKGSVFTVRLPSGATPDGPTWADLTVMAHGSTFPRNILHRRRERYHAATAATPKIGMNAATSFNSGMPAWWDAESEEVQLLAELSDLTRHDRKRKPEALLILGPTASGLRALIMFDGIREGGPIDIEISAPRR